MKEERRDVSLATFLVKYNRNSVIETNMDPWRKVVKR